MIKFDFSENCYQCGNCKSVCPQNLIEYERNSMGDFIPVIDESKCIECKLCEKVCPHLNVTGTNEFKKIVSAYGRDGVAVNRSASGGVFWSIAKEFLDKGGYICGCVLQEDLKAEHILSNNVEDLIRMQGSKYVKSNTEKVLPQIKKCLENGKNVLFCGTPCQVSAIEKRFLKYRNQLYLVGLFCHGIPSQKVFDVYIEWLEKKYNKKVIDVIFRSKSHVLKEHEIVFEDGSRKFYYKNESTYMCYFGGGVLLNTCYETNCQYKNNFVGDLMIGDAWGYQGNLKKGYKGRISNIICLSERGVSMIDTDALTVEPAKLELIYENQPYLQHGFAKINDRDIILRNLNKDNWEKNIYKYKFSNKIRKIVYTLGVYPLAVNIKKVINGR